MAKSWTADEIVRIVSYGGGIDTYAGRFTVDEAVKIASYAANKGSRVIFRDTAHWTADEAVKIASYGKGAVMFAD